MLSQTAFNLCESRAKQSRGLDEFGKSTVFKIYI